MQFFRSTKPLRLFASKGNAIIGHLLQAVAYFVPGNCDGIELIAENSFLPISENRWFEVIFDLKERLESLKSFQQIHIDKLAKYDRFLSALAFRTAFNSKVKEFSSFGLCFSKSLLDIYGVVGYPYQCTITPSEAVIEEMFCIIIEEVDPNGRKYIHDYFDKKYEYNYEGKDLSLASLEAYPDRSSKWVLEVIDRKRLLNKIVSCKIDVSEYGNQEYSELFRLLEIDSYSERIFGSRAGSISDNDAISLESIGACLRDDNIAIRLFIISEIDKTIEEQMFKKHNGIEFKDKEIEKRKQRDSILSILNDEYLLEQLSLTAKNDPSSIVRQGASNTLNTLKALLK